MILDLPIVAAPGQYFRVILLNQDCGIRICQRRGNIYCDLDVSGAPIWTGLLCHDRAPLKHFRRDAFVGNLVFVDYEGRDDPRMEGLGARWRLKFFTDDVALDDSFLFDGSRIS